MKILVTGVAGFIGFHVVQKLLQSGDEVVGIDSINDYYDQRLKYGRLSVLGIEESSITAAVPIPSSLFPNFEFYNIDIADNGALCDIFEQHSFDAVCNLAAQAGVRYSLENPDAYIQSNIIGFQNILECCRHFGIKNLCYASSSSVYGLNSALPFSETVNVDHPISLYAATKKSNELVAHTYSHLFGISTTGLRFFTVYGPWGRPDMALFLFAKAAFSGEPIDIYNHGNMLRDFTYIDDIVEGVVKVIYNPASVDSGWDESAPNPATSSAPYAVYNIGNNNPVKLMDFVYAIENAVGVSISKNFMDLQPGDVPQTYADVRLLEKNFMYRPATTIDVGISKFIDWYREFYDV